MGSFGALLLVAGILMVYWGLSGFDSIKPIIGVKKTGEGKQ